jgi:hypothetical protein
VAPVSFRPSAGADAEIRRQYLTPNLCGFAPPLTDGAVLGEGEGFDLDLALLAGIDEADVLVLDESLVAFSLRQGILPAQRMRIRLYGLFVVRPVCLLWRPACES